MGQVSKSGLNNQIPKTLVLQMQGVPFVDASGIHALRELHHECYKKNVELRLTGVDETIQKYILKSGLNISMQ